VVDVALIDVDDRCRMAFIHCLSSWQSLMELYGSENLEQCVRFITTNSLRSLLLLHRPQRPHRPHAHTGLELVIRYRLNERADVSKSVSSEHFYTAHRNSNHIAPQQCSS